MTCPGELELARALACGGDAELDAHLAACAACRAAWDSALAAIELARELPLPMPSPGRREEVRTAILAAAASVDTRPAPRRWWGLAIAAVALASGAGYLAITRTAAPHQARGAVHPLGAARYTMTSGGGEEIVRLSDGAIDIEVEPLRPGERFRVVIGGTELEVRGTEFHVIAHADQLVEVAVVRGRVDVHPAAGEPTTLTAGQSWRAPGVPVAAAEPEQRAVPPPASAPAAATAQRAMQALASAPAAAGATAPSRIAAPRRRERERVESPSTRAGLTAALATGASPPPDASAAPSAERERPAMSRSDGRAAPAEPATPDIARPPDERSYDDAWAALRGGEFARAASGFARVVLLAPDSPLIEDARFWRAVALARAQRGAEAVAAFGDFLDHHARSPRAGQASAMLGWLLIDARAFDEAARRFRAAAGDPDPAVQRSARAGLDALSRRAADR